jgi:hypothetical protein
MALYVKPPEQDEANAVIKTLHICPTRGCSETMQKNNKRCDTCQTAAERKVKEDECDAHQRLAHG